MFCFVEGGTWPNPQ